MVFFFFVVILVIVGLMAWASIATFRAMQADHAGAAWWAMFVLFSVAGAGAGVWCGGFCEYQATPQLRFISFPIPAAAFHLENGHWIDYVSPLTPLIALLNMVIVFFLLLLPFSATYLLVRKRNRKRATAISRGRDD